MADFLFENYMSILALRSRGRFRSQSILLMSLRLRSNRDSHYVFMPVLCFFVGQLNLKHPWSVLHCCDKVTGSVQLCLPEAKTLLSIQTQSLCFISQMGWMKPCGQLIGSAKSNRLLMIRDSGTSYPFSLHFLTQPTDICPSPVMLMNWLWFTHKF